MIDIRKLEPADAEALFELRRRALVEEPFAFLASPEDDAASSPESIRALLAGRAGDAVFGAVERDQLIGMAAVSRDRPVKAAHRVCIWGVFVDRQHRRQGVASRLLLAVLNHARGLDGVGTAYLSVSEKTPGAKRLYESVGFAVWGVEPDCIRIAGESACEYHLSMAVSAPSRG
jgi:RimJ/RimL family protein N-acetyltransferase